MLSPTPHVPAGGVGDLRDNKTPAPADKASLTRRRFDAGSQRRGGGFRLRDPPIAANMRAAASRVRHMVRAAYLDVGRELLAVEGQMEHGQFIAWVETECGMSIRTAERLMIATKDGRGKRQAVVFVEDDHEAMLPFPLPAGQLTA